MSRTGVTQRDLARHLGLGQKTVSRALGAPGPVSEATRHRVEAAAEALGYRRHSSAASMRSGRFQHVLLIQGMNPAASNLPHEQLYGIHDRLATREVALGVTRFDDEALTSEGFLPRTLRELAADGLLIKYDINVPVKLAEHIARHRLPAVWINSKREHDAVYPDDHGAGALATEHLLDLGHRRVCYLDRHHRGNPVFHYSREDRRQGYRAVMGAAGLEVLEILDDDSSLVERLRDLRPSAIVGYGGGDLGAALYAASQLGWRVPQDLSLICAAGHPIDLGVPVTTVTADDRRLGELAADLLLAKLDAPERQLPSRTIDYHLVPGVTTAGPATD